MARPRSSGRHGTSAREPLGEELLANGDFSNGLPGRWSLERDSRTKAEWSVRNDGPAGGKSLRIAVVRQGEVSWHPQLVQAGFAVKKDHPYTLAFQARTDKPRRISVNCMMAHEPWERLGLSSEVRSRDPLACDSSDLRGRPGRYQREDLADGV